MERLQDRVAVVTGAGSGIGLASVRRLAGEGAIIVAVDIDEQHRVADAEFGLDFLHLEGDVLAAPKSRGQ